MPETASAGRALTMLRPRALPIGVFFEEEDVEQQDSAEYNRGGFRHRADRDWNQIDHRIFGSLG